MIAILALSLVQDARALALADPEGGMMEVVNDAGDVSTLPLLRSEVNARIDGDLASVTLTQTFANPGDVPLDARYLFPLPEDAAVHAMTMTAGDLVVRAEIREKEQARKEYETAKAEGKQAALLTQHRPNVFTQEVANLPPGEQVVVELSYAWAVPREDGAYAFMFPMTVGPRFIPGGGSQVEGAAAELNAWAPGMPVGETTPPKTVGADRIRLNVTLNGGVRVGLLESPTHPVTMRADGPRVRHVSLDTSADVPNDDFILRYRLGHDDVGVGVMTEGEGGEGTVSLLIEPPQAIERSAQVPREMVFLLDTSCSMKGKPMDASKRFMLRALDTLGEQDSFRIIRFSDDASALSDEPLPATGGNIVRGKEYVRELSGNGGTQMTRGITAALSTPPRAGVMRTVVFLTDGYIGNEGDIIALVEKLDSDARLFALGIGGSVNRYLLTELARVGRGTARVVTEMDKAEAEADRLAERLAAPVMADLVIDWGDAPVRLATPERLPDLFLGDSLRVLARYDGVGTFPITLRGRNGSAPVEIPVTLELPQRGEGGEALRLVWARYQIEDLMQQYTSPANADRREQLQSEVTAMGLEHGLVTQWTAFVAVADEKAVASNDGPKRQVELPSRSGNPVRTNYGGGSFSGSASPEPAGWAAILLLLGLGRRALRGSGEED
ncbi:MAG: VWA domain-containing protein [Alphaproteobacteria bacterium]|nr:VWA domain-containing protein [Alphaproteobacteria bacterium]